MNKTELLKIINKSSSGFSNVDLDIDKLETDLNWFYPLMKNLNSTYNGNPILHNSIQEQYKDAIDFSNRNIRKIEEAPTGMGKSGLIFYICIQWFLKNMKRESSVFHLINPLNVLNDQTTFELVFVIKHFIKEFGFKTSDFVILFNRCNVNDATKSLENTKWEDGFILKDSFEKYDSYKNKKFKIIISCVPSVPNIEGKWSKEECCTVIDEVHTMKCSNNNLDEEENDTKKDWTKIWKVINEQSAIIRGITATTTQELLDDEFNLYTNKTTNDISKNLNIVYFDDALKSGRVVKPHALYKGWNGKFSLTSIMNDQKKWNEEAKLNNDIAKILWSAKNNEEIAKLITENDYVGVFYISTCYFDKLKGRINPDKTIEIICNNMTVKQFSDAIENETEDCYIFHIKQLIAGVNVKGLTGCVLQQIQSNTDYITTKQTIGRCLRKKGNKNGGIVTYLIEDKDNGMNESSNMDKIRSLMFTMYGKNWSCKSLSKKGTKKGCSKDPNPAQEENTDFDPSSFTWVLKLKEDYDNYINAIKQAKECGNDTMVNCIETLITSLTQEAASKHCSLGHKKKCESMLENFLVNSTWETL